MSAWPKLYVISITIVVTMYACLVSPCDVTLQKEMPIPGTDLKCVVYRVGCGATVQDSYQVSIVDAAAKCTQDSRGNVFITDDVRFNFETDVHFNVETNTIEIREPDPEKTFKREGRVAGIKIEYK